MESNFNLSSLKIVQAPLMEYFKQAGKNIEDNLNLVNEKKEPTQFDAIEIVSKIQKTLKMIGLFGFSKVLFSVQDGLIAIKEKKLSTDNFKDMLVLCDIVIKNGSLYIQSLTSGAIDQPVKFFEDYKKINELLDKVVFVKDLFSPKLDFKPSYSEEIQQGLKNGIFINENNKNNLLGHLKKVNEVIDVKAKDILDLVNSNILILTEDDKKKSQGTVKSLYEALDHLQKLKISKNSYILAGLNKFYLCVLSPVFNAHFNEYVSENKEQINKIVNQMVKVGQDLLKTVEEMEDGEKTGTLKADDQTVTDLVFEVLFVIKSNPKLTEMPVFTDLDAYFDIVYYSDQLLDTKIDLINIVYNADEILQIERLFGDVKEEFSLLGNKKNASSEIFINQLQKVTQINNKLAESLTSVKEISPLLLQVGATFSIIKNKELKLTEVIEKEVSLALVLTEYGINNFIKNSVDERNRTDFFNQVKLQINRLQLAVDEKLEELNNLPLPVLDATSKKSDERKAFTKIFDQVHQELVKVEDILDGFLRSDEDISDDIKSIIKPLSNMKGIFSVISKPVLSAAVDDILKIWKFIAENGKSQVEKSHIEDSIALLSGLSLFISAFKNENEAEAEEIYNNILKKFAHLDKTLSNVNFETVASTNHHVEEKAIEKEKEIIDEAKTIVLNVTTPLDTTSGVKVSNYTESPNDPELAEFFLMEAEEVLDNMSKSMGLLNKDLTDKEELTNVRRYYHTLKGSGRMVGLEFFGEAGWMVEQTLNKCLQDELEFNSNIYDAINWMMNNFNGWVNDLKTNNSVSIDLVTIKKKFLLLNPGITNHVEINTSDVIVEEEVSNIEVEATPEVIETVEIQTELGFVEDVSHVEVEATPEVSETIEIHTELGFVEDEVKSEVSNDLVESFEESIVEEISMKEDVSHVEVEVNPEVNETIEIHTELGFVEDEIKEDEILTALNESLEEPRVEKESVNESTDIHTDLSFIDANSDQKLIDINVGIEKEEEKDDSQNDFLEIKKDFILIDGKEISTSLFSLFSEESSDHIKKLKEFVESNYAKEVHFNEEFMRHAHTLASIARTVNLIKVAEVSGLVENIATISMEKQIPLESQEMNVVRHAVNGLDNFKTLNQEIDQSYYLNIVKHLTDLYNYIVEKQFESDTDLMIEKELAEVNPEISNDVIKTNPVDNGELIESIGKSIAILMNDNARKTNESLKKLEENLQENFKNIELNNNEIISELRQKINNSSVDDKISQVKDDILNGVNSLIHEALDDIKSNLNNSEQSSFDAGDVVAEFNKSLLENNDLLLTSLKEESQEQKLVISKLSGEIEQLKIVIQKFSENQVKLKSDILAHENEQMTVIRKDMRLLANTFKKYSKSSFLDKLFGKKNAS